MDPQGLWGLFMVGGESAGTAGSVASAHARLLHDPSIQFSFDAPPPPAPPPSWLIDLFRAIGKVLHLTGPVAAWVLWGLLAVGVLAILVLVGREFLQPIASRAAKSPANLRGADDWRPTPARATALLEDADRLAAEGRYAEAAHLLLIRSVEDAEGRRPGLIAPSFTSRDIARLPDMPPEPRRAFGRIAEVVERAVFAKRPIVAADWALCREAYTGFAFPDAWAAR